MLKFFQDADFFINRNPRTYYAIIAAMALFFIATIALSIFCPPAALAIGIGSWSLMGNILPLVSTSFIGLFILFSGATLLSRLFPISTNNNRPEKDVNSEQRAGSSHQKSDSNVKRDHYTKLFPSQEKLITPSTEDSPEMSPAPEPRPTLGCVIV